MKIGIFLGYQPHITLKKEGLGRYIANLIKGFLENGEQIIIACPKWLMPHIDELLADFNIRKDDIEFIVANRVSALWRIYDKFFYNRKNKTIDLKGKWKFRIKLIVDHIISFMISITSIIFLLIIFFLFLILFFCLIPFFFIGFLLLGLLKLIRICIRTTKSKWFIPVILKNIQNNFMNSGYNIYLYILNLLQESITDELVRMINSGNYKVDVWYSPSFFWSEFNNIKGVKVINAPDLVTAEFPGKFADERFTILSLKKIEKTITGGSYFITYCNFIKQRLLIDKFGKESDDVVAIPHGVNFLDQFVQIDTEEVKRFNVGDDFSKAFARGVLQTLAPNNIDIISYTNTFKFDNTKYLFYSSQARPYKNIWNLVRAFERILRNRYFNIKLIMTCNLNDLPDVKNYIISRGLQKDILTFRNVSNQQLAALYSCAELIVTPTLYEGGFPFTFGEGMSVNTPSIMSRIPQVEEVVEGYDLEDCLFDPYIVEDMEEKIVFGLENRDFILKKQSRLFHDLSKRDWKIVAQEYLNTFKYFIEKEREGMKIQEI